MQTSAEIKERLDDYRAAEKKVLRKQSYLIGDKEMTYANLAHIQDMIGKLCLQLQTSQGKGTIRVRGAVFVDC